MGNFPASFFYYVSKMRTLHGPLLKSYLCGASEKVQTCVTETQTRRPEFGSSEPDSQEFQWLP